MFDMWKYAVGALKNGDFTALEETLGGPSEFDRYITGWIEAGNFDDDPSLLAEALTCACMLGRVATAELLLDNGVDPYGGMLTGLAGPHYAAGGGRLDVIKMLIRKGISLEVKNTYGGTPLGQALWSAVNEPETGQADVMEALIAAGAVVEPGTAEWSAETKRRIAEILECGNT